MLHVRLVPKRPGAIQSGAWLVLVVSLPTANAEARMKILRTLESMGAGVLREGAYVMPDSPTHRDSMERLAAYVAEAGGAADLISTHSTGAAQQERFRGLFNRAAAYEDVVQNIRALEVGFGISDPSAIARVLQRQRAELEAIAARDYFPGIARDAAFAVAEETERTVQRLMFPAQTSDAQPVKDARKKYFHRVWATRQPLWADRLASGWLIRRFIDAEASLIWLGKTDSPPEGAVTYGYEGAEFSNSSTRLTYEQLLAFFRLDRNQALVRIGTLARALETGDQSLVEAKGVEAMLQGAHRRTKSDRSLLAESEKTFDLLYETFSPHPGVS